MSFKNIQAYPDFSLSTCREHLVNLKHVPFQSAQSLDFGDKNNSFIFLKVVKNHMRKVGTSIPEAGLAAIRSNWR
jgi:hypothetical protein